ncbi:hypothetical protein O3G_MSEX015254 [Manduca sexta]|uniref:Uncharacterized protein n=1 Tax=Manduca sexta TaxID=7130 RepID=A0A922A078_MANSE|nr:hypothetical protein O3G_MSEX015254 [Manduca sexta]
MIIYLINVLSLCARSSSHTIHICSINSLCAIRTALEQLKSNKAPDEDGITAELLKVSGALVLKVFQELFNSVLLEDVSPNLTVSKMVSLGLNTEKTKVMSSVHVTPTSVTVGN